MWASSRRRVIFFLAAVSVAGLLSMHGLDPVVASEVDHSSHSSDTETGVDAHEAIGLCVFVVAVATFGIPSIRRRQSAQHVASLLYQPGLFTPTQPLITSGSRLLSRLCVLRL